MTILGRANIDKQIRKVASPADGQTLSRKKGTQGSLNLAQTIQSHKARALQQAPRSDTKR